MTHLTMIQTVYAFLLGILLCYVYEKVWLSEGSDRFAYLPEYRVDPLYRGRSVQMAGRRSDEDGTGDHFKCFLLFRLICYDTEDR